MCSSSSKSFFWHVHFFSDIFNTLNQNNLKIWFLSNTDLTFRIVEYRSTNALNFDTFSNGLRINFFRPFAPFTFWTHYKINVGTNNLTKPNNVWLKTSQKTISSYDFISTFIKHSIGVFNAFHINRYQNDWKSSHSCSKI